MSKSFAFEKINHALPFYGANGGLTSAYKVKIRDQYVGIVGRSGSEWVGYRELPMGSLELQHWKARTRGEAVIELVVDSDCSHTEARFQVSFVGRHGVRHVGFRTKEAAARVESLLRTFDVGVCPEMSTLPEGVSPDPRVEPREAPLPAPVVAEAPVPVAEPVETVASVVSVSKTVHWQPVDAKVPVEVVLTRPFGETWIARVGSEVVGQLSRHPLNPAWGWVYRRPTTSQVAVTTWKGSGLASMDAAVSALMFSRREDKERDRRSTRSFMSAFDQWVRSERASGREFQVVQNWNWIKGDRVMTTLFAYQGSKPEKTAGSFLNSESGRGFSDWFLGLTQGDRQKVCAMVSYVVCLRFVIDTRPVTSLEQFMEGSLWWQLLSAEERTEMTSLVEAVR